MTFSSGTSVTYLPGFTYVLTWHSLTDACPKCQQLNGHEYRDQDIFKETLWDPIWGDIWDFITDHTLAHPNCRCQLEVRVIIDWSQVPEMQELKTILEQLPEVKIEWLPPEEFTEVGQIEQMRDAISALNKEMSTLTMSYHELRELETILMRTLTMLERSTGSKEVREAINALQRLISIVRMAQFTIHAFQVATGPIGWIFAISGAISTTITAADMVASIGYDSTRGR